MFTNVGFPSTSFNVYQPYIVALPGVGDSAGSIIIGTRTFVSLICMFAVVRFYQIFDCRRGSLIAAVATVTCFIVFGFAQSFPLLCLAAAIGGIGYGLGGMVCTTMLINRWFKADVGTALGISAVGSGAASIVVPLCADWIIRTFGLSISFWCEAALAAVLGVLIYALLRDKPSDMGLEPFVNEKWLAEHTTQAADGSGETVVVTDDGYKLSPVQRALFIFAMMLIGAVCVASATFVSIFLVSEGYDHAFAALILSAVGLVLTVGKFAMGRIFDMLGDVVSTIIAFVALIVGLVLLCIGAQGSVAFVWVGVVFFGFGLAIGTTGIPIWSLHLSSPEQRVGTVRTFQVGYAAGSFVFTLVPGILKDIVGSYMVSYVMMIGMSFIALTIILIVLLQAKRASVVA